MQLIRCTGKLRKEMGLRNSDLSEVEPTNHFLGSWHANLIYINRSKCVLFVNDQTLFNFIVPSLPRSEIKKLGAIFQSHLECVLSDQGFDESVKSKIMSEYEKISYAKTNNSSVLGSMNDLAFHYKYFIHQSGGVHSAAIPGIIRKLNEMPMGALDYAYAIEALKSLVREQHNKLLKADAVNGAA